jgi:hypothetical protein
MKHPSGVISASPRWHRDASLPLCHVRSAHWYSNECVIEDVSRHPEGMWKPLMVGRYNRAMRQAWGCLVGYVCAQVLMLSGCSPGTGFECGASAPQGTIRECDDRGQVCVCDTGSCADRDPECDSGYRYAGTPFAAEARAGSCVEERDIRWTVKPDDTARECPSTPPADAGVDASAPDASADGGAS